MIQRGKKARTHTHKWTRSQIINKRYHKQNALKATDWNTKRYAGAARLPVSFMLVAKISPSLCLPVGFVPFIKLIHFALLLVLALAIFCRIFVVIHKWSAATSIALIKLMQFFILMYKCSFWEALLLPCALLEKTIFSLITMKSAIYFANHFL